jgi:hypothetical protein
MATAIPAVKPTTMELGTSFAYLPIFWRKSIVPDNCRLVCWRIEQRGAGLRRKDFVLLHRGPFAAQRWFAQQSGFSLFFNALVSAQRHRQDISERPSAS